jgi:hypoxanthine-DNA glycosylase
MKQAFSAIAERDARILILGSMPGEASLQQQQYYAHPRNAFWRIMEALYGIPADLPYSDRTQALRRRHVALWDVMQSCRRPGSLDANIEPGSIVVNDFAGFLQQHPMSGHIFFNGARAAQEYERRALPILSPGSAAITRTRLPSTSPAMAMLTFEQKLQQWLPIQTVSAAPGGSVTE